MKAKTGFEAVSDVSVAWISRSPARVRVALSLGDGEPTLVPLGQEGWKVVVRPTAQSHLNAHLVGEPLAMRSHPALAAPKGLRAAALTPTSTLNGTITAMRPGAVLERPPIAPKAAPKVSLTTRKARRVSLDFVDTNVDGIFRALAIQTGSNILVSNEVGAKGKTISISLHDVDVEHAVNLLCTISGLRWSKADGTYVITSKEQFQETARMANNSPHVALETRVVPLFSQEGSQVKTAILKAIGGDDNARGRFEIFLPSEKLEYDQKQDVTPEGKGKESDQAKLTIRTSEGKTKDSYLVIVGSPARLDEVQALAGEIDGQICRAMGKERPTSTIRFTRVYDVRGGRANELLEAIAGKDAKRIGDVEILATPSNSQARQTIVLSGREDQVNLVYTSLSQLDASDGAAPEFRLVELSFSDPRSMREMLVANVPGLSVTIPPASVGNPRLFQSKETLGQAQEQGRELPKNGGTSSGEAPVQGTNQNVNVGADSLQMNGLQQPYKDYESVAMPMRLVLRGTSDQLARGVALLRALDTAPKHVAIELRVMELNRDEALAAGIDFNLQNGGAVRFLRLNNSQGNPSNTGSLSLGSKGTPLDITASLDRISNRNNLISRPNSIALDGRETELFVGDVIRYIKSIISSQNGVTVTTDEVRVGVRMAILPRIGGDGSITMDLRPAVSFLRGFDPVPQIGGKLPQTSERVAQSSFNMRSGETIAIAGLITDQDRRAVQGLPFLMDLPVVGQLFRKTTNERIRSELVIFVTARTIEGPLGSELQTLPGQPELPAHKGFPGPEASDSKSRTKAGRGEGKGAGPGTPAPPFSPPLPKPKNG
ncbi:MAG: hypothetical protein C4320_01415 [Armatimonadota bacterium]